MNKTSLTTLNQQNQNKFNFQSIQNIISNKFYSITNTFTNTFNNNNNNSNQNSQNQLMNKTSLTTLNPLQL